MRIQRCSLCRHTVRVSAGPCFPQLSVKRLLFAARRKSPLRLPQRPQTANDPRRRWPVERLAVVGSELARKGARLVVVGTAADQPLADRQEVALLLPVSGG